METFCYNLMSAKHLASSFNCECVGFVMATVHWTLVQIAVLNGSKWAIMKYFQCTPTISAYSLLGRRTAADRTTNGSTVRPWGAAVGVCGSDTEFQASQSSTAFRSFGLRSADDDVFRFRTLCCLRRRWLTDRILRAVTR